MSPRGASHGHDPGSPRSFHSADVSPKHIPQHGAPTPRRTSLCHTRATQIHLTKSTLLPEPPPCEHTPWAWAAVGSTMPRAASKPRDPFHCSLRCCPYTSVPRTRPPVRVYTCPATYTNTTGRGYSPRVCRHAALHGGDRPHALLMLTLDTQLSSAAHRLASKHGLTPKQKTDRSHKHSPRTQTDTRHTYDPLNANISIVVYRPTFLYH